MVRDFKPGDEVVLVVDDDYEPLKKGTTGIVMDGHGTKGWLLVQTKERKHSYGMKKNDKRWALNRITNWKEVIEK